MKSAQRESSSSWRILQLPAYGQLPLFAFTLLLITGCNAVKWPVEPEGCKVRTYIQTPLRDHLSARYDSKAPVRAVIFPFIVPETFTGGGINVPNLGVEMSQEFAAQLREEGTIPIVELSQLDRWPGRREDFSYGNYQALQISRDAGYDLVILGYLEDLKGDDHFKVQLKLIDVPTNSTVFHGLVDAYSQDRLWRRETGRTWFVQDRPAIYSFAEIIDEAARCGVEAMVNNPDRQ